MAAPATSRESKRRQAVSGSGASVRQSTRSIATQCAAGRGGRELRGDGQIRLRVGRMTYFVRALDPERAADGDDHASECCDGSNDAVTSSRSLTVAALAAPSQI
jgi:hypothetical protein